MFYLRRGAIRNPIWRTIATDAASDVATVYTLFCSVVDYASEQQPVGNIAGFDHRPIADFLQKPVDELRRILDAFDERQIIEDGVLCSDDIRFEGELNR